MSWLSQAFGSKSYQNPADAARPYLEQIPGQLHQSYDPYIQQGRQAGQMTQEQYDRLINDPQGFINEIQEGYKPSEGYQFQKEQGLGAMRNSAASGGFAGTPYDQERQSQYVEGLLGQDMQNYMNNVLGLYNRGLGGEERIQGQGFQAGLGLGDSLANALMQQAGLEFRGVEGRNAANESLRNALLKGGGALVGGVTGLPDMNTMPSQGGYFF